MLVKFFRLNSVTLRDRRLFSLTLSTAIWTYMIFFLSLLGKMCSGGHVSVLYRHDYLGSTDSSCLLQWVPMFCAGSPYMFTFVGLFESVSYTSISKWYCLLLRKSICPASPPHPTMCHFGPSGDFWELTKETCTTWALWRLECVKCIKVTSDRAQTWFCFPFFHHLHPRMALDRRGDCVNGFT